MIDRPIQTLPWPEIHADLRRLAAEEARRLPVPHGAADDAAQEACAKLIRIGVANLPPELMSEGRGGWLRLVVRNVLRAMAREEGRWRQANGPIAAEHHDAARQARAALPALEESVDISWLPAWEWRVLTFLRMGLVFHDVAKLEVIGAEEVVRRVKWAGLRIRVPNGRRTLHLGRKPGSLADLRASRRGALATMLSVNGWSPAELAVDFGISRNAAKLILRDHANRVSPREFEA